MSVIDSSPQLLPVNPPRTVFGRLADLWRYRELLKQLVRRELKVKYRNSVLGFAWSMLNPAFLMLVYATVFSILGQGFQRFAIWLIIGLLTWNFFSTALVGGTGSIVGNAYLVGKVRFPREILPLAAVGAAFIHFLLQSVVLIITLAATRAHVDWAYISLIPLALLVLVLVACGLAVLLGTVNVYARDTQHLLELAILAWFWATPVIYQFERVGVWLGNKGVPTWLPLTNPATVVIITLQRALFGSPDGRTSGGAHTPVRLLPTTSVWWYLRNLSIWLGVALVLLYVVLRWFDKAEGDLAEVM